MGNLRRVDGIDVGNTTGIMYIGVLMQDESGDGDSW